MLALSVAGLGLTVLFERHIARSAADDLDVHLRQLLAGIDVDELGHLVLIRAPIDPRFNDPLSGLYWQVSDNRGTLIRSRSLWDSALDLPPDAFESGDEHLHRIQGPGAATLMAAERSATLESSKGSVPIRAAVALDLTSISAATKAFARDLVVALGLLGGVLALATSVQVTMGLRPLGRLQRGVARIRSGRSRRLDVEVPLEVLPLVEEVNGLLAAQEREIERSRGRAADLAHGLKTPLAALAADAVRLREKGEDRLAQDIEQVCDGMSRHVDRELTRARLSGAAMQDDSAATELAPLVRSLTTIQSRTPAGQAISFESDIADGTLVPMERVDLAEVLGNLLENATRHAKTRVRVRLGSIDRPSIVVEDDGDGLCDGAYEAVLARGVRLDQRSQGAGLGLAIVQDVLEAYGWTLQLDRSDLGGLRAICNHPGAVHGQKSGEEPPSSITDAAG